MTPFCFEHVFVADGPGELFAAYFDVQHQIEQDRVLEIREREVIELFERGDEIVRRSRVVPSRQLPALLRPLASGPLHYIEHAVGRRAAHMIDIDLRLFGDRGRVTARYELAQMAPGSVRRRYSGVVSVDVALVAGRVERGIVTEFERSLSRASSCTQNWLVQQTPRSAAARA
ncbi:MAG TPA: DUF2505 family protein [Kofleriaceae bacterium]|nr:DUF2505 family protein [Kofleriaceae bacterium]